MIKKYFCNLEKITGFWHSIDNIKDLDMVNKKNIYKKKFIFTKKLQKKIKSLFNKMINCLICQKAIK